MFKSITDFPLGEAIIYYENLAKDYSPNLLPILDSLTYYTGKYNDYSVKRDQIWFHQHKRYINPTWPIFERWIPHEYPEQFVKLQSELTTHIQLAKIGKFTPNSLLLNKYNNGKNIIPKHQDSEEMFGDNPTIAVYSLGATRTIRFTLISDKTNTIDIELENNSLLVMAGTTQKYYYHELLKEPEIKDVRYSFTFREHML